MELKINFRFILQLRQRYCYLRIDEVLVTNLLLCCSKLFVGGYGQC